MKYITKEEKSLKNITKDSLIVFLCGMVSIFALEQFNIKNTRTMFNQTQNGLQSQGGLTNGSLAGAELRSGPNDLNSYLSQKEFSNKLQSSESLLNLSEKALGQRRLKRQYTQERLLTSNNQTMLKNKKVYNYLDYNALNATSYRKQTQQAMQEEESKKVFMIIIEILKYY